MESGTQEPVQKLLTIGGLLALVLKTFKKSLTYYAPQ